MNRKEVREILDAPIDNLPNLLDAAYRIRRHYHGNRVKLCMLLNAQSGQCPEDCFYCSQAKDSEAPIQKYRLMRPDQMLVKARQAVQAGAKRFCIVCSGTGPNDRIIDQMGSAVQMIKNEFPWLEICTSLGIMSLEKASKLKEAGVGWINHNLNTSERYYEKICTTHTYQDRVNTVNNVKAAGLQTCSGGIIGMGETVEDVIDFLFTVQKMDMDSIPINFLYPVEGTPLGNRPTLDPIFSLKVLCLARLMNPSKEVRVAGGRELNLKGLQMLALYPANSIFVEGYLTTPGTAADETRRFIENCGFEVEEAKIPEEVHA